MDRYQWLERQLDRLDLTDEEFNTYNRELNSLQDLKNKRLKEQRAIREAKRQEEIEEALLAKALALTEEQVEKMYTDACLKYQDVNGMSFESWYKQSLRYYEIDDQHNVHARARTADESKIEIISHPTRAQAQLTILRRIKYKFYDHAVRGHDFAWDIESKGL